MQRAKVAAKSSAERNCNLQSVAKRDSLRERSLHFLNDLEPSALINGRRGDVERGKRQDNVKQLASVWSGSNKPTSWRVLIQFNSRLNHLRLRLPLGAPRLGLKVIRPFRSFCTPFSFSWPSSGASRQSEK